MRIEKRFRAQGIRDAERPMGLKERCALGALRSRSRPEVKQVSGVRQLRTEC